MAVNIITIFFSIVGAVIIIGIAMRVLKNMLSKPKIVQTTVVNKQEYEQMNIYKNQTPKEEQKYVVSFLCGGKRKDFYVSLYMYDSLRINQTGKLTYKGDRIMDFS